VYFALGGGDGGGVGITGTGSSGTGGTGGVYNGAEGTDGGNGSSGAYGGGAASLAAGRWWQTAGDPGGALEYVNQDSSGGTGAVRIMWGGGRSYPSNAADV
jgi:hypothetical protein